MHLDGDAFFVSVEMAKDPSLRGKPVVTGQERGIASALSYEAKKLGITRAAPIFQIRKQFPQVKVVNSDYEAYAVFSKRMMNIVRRYADTVEEYSIDECFADFSDVPGFASDPRPTLERIQREISRDLGISVSLGLGPTKVIAKIASKSSKPSGLVVVGAEDREKLLSDTSIHSVWGIGSATAFSLRKKGVSTALELARKPREWVEEYFSKPMVEMWYELNGVSVKRVGTEYEDQKSISKTRTFSPATGDKSRVFSELSRNIENACGKARGFGLAALEMSIFLKTRDFSYLNARCRFSYPVNDPFEAIQKGKGMFEQIFKRDLLYRATGATLHGLMPVEARQEDMFGASSLAHVKDEVFRAVDAINEKHGKGVVRIASSSWTRVRSLGGEGRLKKLTVPFLGEAF